MGKIPNPCIDVCKYKLRGHCIACAMTKQQKRTFESMSGSAAKREFLAMLVQQQIDLGDRFKAWGIAYRRKCEKKGVPFPLD